MRRRPAPWLRAHVGSLPLALALLGCSDLSEPVIATPRDAAPEVASDVAAEDTRDAEAPLDADTLLDADTAFDTSAPLDADTPLDVGLSSDVAPPRDVAAARDVVAVRDAGPPPPTTSLLLNGTAPMPCADPALFSATDAGATYYAYCTGMSHVWVTSDWTRFSDQRAATRFDLTGMSANGREVGAWWAPDIVYAPDLRKYVMWVSVPDARGTRDASGWDTRSLAVLTADTPTGPWVYRGLGLAATAVGQHFIDPFLFRDHDGRRYVFFKRYGGGVSSSIVGAAVDATWLHLVAGSQVEIMDGFGGPGTWEQNVRENPAVRYDAATGRHHMLFSGGHWDDDSYATGHALSACGPLCTRAAGGGWRIVSSGDRGVNQVVQASGDANFSHGGPGGAVYQDDRASFIVYAAAARSARGDSTRYLMRQAIRWRNDAPFVDTAGHRPAGL